MYEKYSVLFVDDEINILHSLQRGLMDEEYSCHFSNSGKDALETMEKEDIAVIITDMRMPEMNGLTLLKTITEKWPRVVKIVLSGYTQLPQVLATVNEVDIFKFITKPWSLDNLTNAIKKALDYYILKEENDNYKKNLESKNKAYHNILKRVDEVIANAKKSSEILGMCGKAILGFGKNFDIDERVKYSSIFSIQDEIFEIFSKSVTSEKKEVSSKNLIDNISQQIIENIPNSKIERQDGNSHTIKVNGKMLEVAMLSLMSILGEDFKTYGLASKMGIGEDERFTISLVSPNAVVDNELIDIKIDFIKSVIINALSMYQILFQIVKINNNLVVKISVEE